MSDPIKILAYETDLEGEEIVTEINLGSDDVRLENDKAYNDPDEWHKLNGPVTTYKIKPQEAIPVIDKAAVGKKLVELRKLDELDRKQAAEKMGINVNSLLTYEHGQYLPQANVMLRIADYYDQPVEEIFFIRETGS